MKIKPSWIGLLLIALLATACNLAAGKPTPSMNVDLTEVQSTLSLLETQVAATSNVASTDTVAPNFTPSDTDTPTSTPMPTDTPYYAPTYIPTQAPVVAPCNQAAFVTDVTIPDNTVVYAGNTFTKTWRLRNTGSCTWSSNYQIVFVSGNSLGGLNSASLGASVAPGQTIDISLVLTAPATAGTYQGNYKLEDASGNIFGTGPSGVSAFYVIIVDNSSGYTPTLSYLAVTSVILSVDNSNVTVNCPPGNTFTFSGNIVINGPGTVTYYWKFSNGTATGEQSIVFSAAGSQTVTIAWTIGANGTLPANPYNASASLYIDNPNHQLFGPQAITIGCTFISPTATLTFTPTSTQHPSATPTSTPRPTATSTLTPAPSATPTPTATPH
jgi:hypothetical protein